MVDEAFSTLAWALANEVSCAFSGERARYVRQWARLDEGMAEKKVNVAFVLGCPGFNGVHGFWRWAAGCLCPGFLVDKG